MLFNYFKVAIRNIRKFKAFSFINIFGLALAMSVCMLLILMLADQGRYDDFHEKKDRTFRILSDFEGSRQPYATSPFPLASALRTEYALIEESTHLTPIAAGEVSNQKHISDVHGYFADPAFFHVFSFDLKYGDKTSALSSPNSIVISTELARKLFGEENAVGRTVEFSDRQQPAPKEFQGMTAIPWGSFTITGVVNVSDVKSHLKFDALVSVASQPALIAAGKLEDLTNNWEWYFRTYTFVVLPPDKTQVDLTAALNDLVAHHYKGLVSEQVKGFRLLPQELTDVQLGLRANDTDNRMPMIGYYFLGLLAIVIMIAACLNYTSLATARALTRAKEIGVRKISGALRKNLILQFLSESVITSLLSLIVALALLYFIAPAFRGLWVNQYLQFELPHLPSAYLGFTVFALLIGVVAGIYPALHLTRKQPVQALQVLGKASSGRMSLRKILCAGQFVLSLLFITSSILIYNQFRHYLSFDYGFSYENIINVDLQGVDHAKLANELQGLSEVTTISACDVIPSTETNNNTKLRKAGVDGEFQEVGYMNADENFVNNLAIGLVAGKHLPPAGEGSTHFILVNEAAVKAWKYNTPSEILGEVFETPWGSERVEVVGVLKDFRYRLLANSHDIGPLIIRNNPSQFKYLNVKVSSNDLMATMTRLEDLWKKIDPVHPFKYEFYDEQLQSTHAALFDIVSILGFIALIAVVIACMGLLGMAIFTAERKTREVGIRKVLGAGEASILLLLSKEFLYILLLSLLIGAPLSFFLNNLWLQQLPNRVEFGIGTILIGTGMLLALGLLTIGTQVLRASRENPVHALKAE
ncbi:MAG: FtsX-like permease family protein [Cyclobacteriaceae bacterium]|nr:FtsX-like permease family protein [Cyclobacteriaceae bacterium]